MHQQVRVHVAMKTSPEWAGVRRGQPIVHQYLFQLAEREVQQRLGRGAVINGGNPEETAGVTLRVYRLV